MKKHLLMVGVGLFLVTFLIGLRAVCAAPEKPIELRFTAFITPTNAIFQNVFAPFAKDLEQMTNGRVEVKFFLSETLGKAKDQYDLVVKGIADMGAHALGFTPGRFPLSSVMELPFNIPSSTIGSRAVHELYEKHLKQEFSDVKLINIAAVEPFNLHLAKKPVKTLGDLKGLRIRVVGPQMQAIVKAWGASPLNLSPSEVYDAIQKGMVDGMLTMFSQMIDSKYNELVKYHTLVNISTVVNVTVMNKISWNKLPPDIQKSIDKLSGVRLSVGQGEALDKRGKEAMEESVKMGHEVYSLPLQERKLWMDRVKHIDEAWIAEMEKKGLPGKKVYDDTIAILGKHLR